MYSTRFFNVPDKKSKFPYNVKRLWRSEWHEVAAGIVDGYDDDAARIESNGGPV